MINGRKDDELAIRLADTVLGVMPYFFADSVASLEHYLEEDEAKLEFVIQSGQEILAYLLVPYMNNELPPLPILEIVFNVLADLPIDPDVDKCTKLIEVLLTYYQDLADEEYAQIRETAKGLLRKLDVAVKLYYDDDRRADKLKSGFDRICEETLKDNLIRTTNWIKALGDHRRVIEQRLYLPDSQKHVSAINDVCKCSLMSL